MTDTRSRSLSAPSWVSLILLVALLGARAMVGLPGADARPNPPTDNDERIAKIVSFLMGRQHLSGHKIDDEISQRTMQSFLKTLDPWKLYFYQSDVDEFDAYRDRLDDLFQQGKIDFAHKVFDRFLTRVNERVATALKWVEAEHDFSIQEEMVKDRDAATYPKNAEEADERWRRRVKFDLLTMVTDDQEMEEAKEKLRKRYSSLAKRWEQTDSDELLELYISALTSAFDPHSSYMSPGTLKNFNIQMKLELDGIGASLRSEDGFTEVHEVISGGAADLDGRLKKGDQIIGVGQGTDGEIEDIVDMKLNDVVELIRGKRGTVVRLEVKPVDNPKQSQIYAITRAQIKLTNQEARSEILEWGTRPNGQPYKLGVIQLPSFYMDMDGARMGLPNYKSTTRDVRRLLEKFNKEQVDMVVVDLRFNGGGSLTEAVNMTGLFIDKGPVVQVKGPDGRTQPYDDSDAGMVWSGPLVVLHNKFSASASEIFAGAIQDYGRGLIIGDSSTHGKGTVQQLFDLDSALFANNKENSLGALKLTIQQFYRPGGASTQSRGVVSDIQLPSLTDHLKGIAESDLDFALEFDRVEALAHDNYQMTDPNVVKQLRERSKERITASEEFAKDLKRIARYEQQKDATTITLNKEEYVAQRNELDAEKEQEEQYEKLESSDRPVFEMDHYGKEALSIAVDYLESLKEKRVAVAR